MDAIAVICSVAKHSSLLDGYNSFCTGTEEIADWPRTAVTGALYNGNRKFTIFSELHSQNF